jgi:phage terminase large subunit-like protein
MSEAGGRDPVAELALLPRSRADWVLGALTTAQRRELQERWAVWAHPGQHIGAGSAGADWRIWVILAGRGFGKTRAGGGDQRGWRWRGGAGLRGWSAARARW